MSKWEPVNPGDLKPGDKFKAMSGKTAVVGVISNDYDRAQSFIDDTEGNEWVTVEWRWFRRKPAKPTRPVEPPAGTVVRNTRSGVVGKHFAPLNDDDTHNWALLKIDGDSEWKKWDDWIAPTDEIEVAEWVKP